MKLMFASQLFVKHSSSEIYGNLRNGLVADFRSQTDRQTQRQTDGRMNGRHVYIQPSFAA